MNDVDAPMGNAELRLALASIENEVSDVKRISMDVHEQAVHTNGTVRWHTKMLWLAMGALPLLTGWAAWLTLYALHASEVTTKLQGEFLTEQNMSQEQIESAAQEGIIQGLESIRTNK